MGVNSGTQFRLNGNIYLVADDGENDPAATVVDDEDSDTLTGNNGTDLFLARLQGKAHDCIVDLRHSEITEGLLVGLEDSTRVSSTHISVRSAGYGRLLKRRT